MTATVAVLGCPSDEPVAMLLQALEQTGCPVILLDPRDPGRPLLQWHLDASGQLRAELGTGRHARPLDDLAGLYLRFPDPARVPDAAAWIQAWVELAELASFTVVNRVSAMASNGSKPLQSRLLSAAGFALPEMLVSRDVAAVQAFEARCAVVYKSASGVRSIVQALDDSSRARLHRVRHMPTLFQQRLGGTNVRVHVVGDEVFATEIDSAALDYRYAGRSGETSRLRATRLDTATEALCRRATRELGLHFAGLDLMLTDDGRVCCFEANPSPGYSWFQNATGQDIAGALARLLAHGV